jgi:hypothetical protein
MVLARFLNGKIRWDSRLRGYDGQPIVRLYEE